MTSLFDILPQLIKKNLLFLMTLRVSTEFCFSFTFTKG